MGMKHSEDVGRVEFHRCTTNLADMLACGCAWLRAVFPSIFPVFCCLRLRLCSVRGEFGRLARCVARSSGVFAWLFFCGSLLDVRVQGLSELYCLPLLVCVGLCSSAWACARFPI